MVHTANRSGGRGTAGGRTRIAAATLAATASLALGVPDGSAAEHPGKQAFQQYCASCHGSTAAGDGPVAGSLKERPRDLRTLGERYGRPLPRPRLIDIIDGRDMARAHGTSDMPVWGKELLEGVPPGAGNEAYKRSTILTIIDWLDSIQTVEP